MSEADQTQNLSSSKIADIVCDSEKFASEVIVIADSVVAESPRTDVAVSCIFIGRLDRRIRFVERHGRTQKSWVK